MQKDIDNIRTLLIKGDIDNALNELLRLSKSNNKDLYNLCSVLASDYHDAKNNEIIGIPDNKGEFKRIKYALLKILNELEKQGVYKLDSLIKELEQCIEDTIDLMHVIPLVDNNSDQILSLSIASFSDKIRINYSIFLSIKKRLSTYIQTNDTKLFSEIFHRMGTYVLMSRQGKVEENVWRYLFEYELSNLLIMLTKLLKNKKE